MQNVINTFRFHKAYAVGRYGFFRQKPFGFFGAEIFFWRKLLRNGYVGNEFPLVKFKTKFFQLFKNKFLQKKKFFVFFGSRPKNLFFKSPAAGNFIFESGEFDFLKGGFYLLSPFGFADINKGEVEISEKGEISFRGAFCGFFRIEKRLEGLYRSACLGISR